MADPLTNLLTQARRPTILAVGDLMLDRYLWGDVQRISPEAPIPVLRVGRQEERLGGAGSVAAMLRALDADVVLVSITGDDPQGQTVRRLLDEVHVDRKSVLTDPHRPTTVKERLLGQTSSRSAQQMIRVDREDVRPIGPDLVDQLLQAAWQHLDRVDLILVSDYGKGVCAGEFIPQLVAIARAAGVPVVADPVRGADYHRYAGCTCITPNRTEAGLALKSKIHSPEDGLEAARRLLRFGVEAALVTLDCQGIAWADAQGRGGLFPVRPRQVSDVTGAGDTVASVLGYCLASGADYPAAVELANLAGGLEVERLGVVPLARRELLDELARDRPIVTTRKILSVDELPGELSRRRRSGGRVVMTNGCFDLLHPGHVASLQQARSLGDLLVVGLNSDRSVRQLKGPGRPIVDQQGRAEILAALACVDYVVIFDDASAEGLIERILPDVLVKSAEYTIDEVVGRDVIERHGGRVVLAPMKSDYSTSRMIRKICQRSSDIV